MRGKVNATGVTPSGHGITPAHAGKSRPAFGAKFLLQDHPRPCGEKGTYGWNADIYEGSPPPMRGKAAALRLAYRRMRITPAHAGKRC